MMLILLSLLFVSMTSCVKKEAPKIYRAVAIGKEEGTVTVIEGPSSAVAIGLGAIAYATSEPSSSSYACAHGFRAVASSISTGTGIANSISEINARADAIADQGSATVKAVGTKEHMAEAFATTTLHTSNGPIKTLAKRGYGHQSGKAVATKKTTVIVKVI